MVRERMIIMKKIKPNIHIFVISGHENQTNKSIQRYFLKTPEIKT